MSEELLDVELRERVKKVRKNSVQRRLRDLVRTMQAWRRAVVMVEADKFAAEQAQTAQFNATTLTETRAALEELESDNNDQAEKMKSLTTANEALSAQVHALQLSIPSMKEEAEQLAQAEARKAVAKAELECADAEARAKSAVGAVRRVDHTAASEGGGAACGTCAVT